MAPLSLGHFSLSAFPTWGCPREGQQVADAPVCPLWLQHKLVFFASVLVDNGFSSPWALRLEWQRLTSSRPSTWFQFAHKTGNSWACGGKVPITSTLASHSGYVWHHSCSTSTLKLCSGSSAIIIMGCQTSSIT